MGIEQPVSAFRSETTQPPLLQLRLIRPSSLFINPGLGFSLRMLVPSNWRSRGENQLYFIFFIFLEALKPITIRSHELLLHGRTPQRSQERDSANYSLPQHS